MAVWNTTVRRWDQEVSALGMMSIDLYSQPCSNASCRTLFTSVWPIADRPASHYWPYLYVRNEWQVLTNEPQSLALNE